MFDDIPELTEGIIALLCGFDANASVVTTTLSPDFANAILDAAYLIPWQQHERSFAVRRCADRLRDAADFIAAWRLGAWRTGGEGFVLRRNVAAYMSQFHEPLSCEHAKAIATSECCGPIRRVMREHGIDAAAFAAATTADPDDLF